RLAHDGYFFSTPSSSAARLGYPTGAQTRSQIELQDMQVTTQTRETTMANEPDRGEQQEGQPGKQENRPLTPEFLAWACQGLNEEEIVAGLREIRATGGLQLRDFIHDLEREAMPRE